MRSLLLGLVLAAAEASAGPDLVRRREYFYLLRPGIATADIVEDVGEPDIAVEGTAIYHLDAGLVELVERDGFLAEAKHVDPGDGALSMSLYWAPPEALRPATAELDERERRIGQGDFWKRSAWGPGFLRTERHGEGLVFLLRGGYVVLEEPSPLMGREGAFADLVSKATLYREGETRVVWRLFDRWPKVRPGYLIPEELSRREEVLVRHCHLDVETLAGKLGEPDGRMGSGIRYDLYYLRDGLLVLQWFRKGSKHLQQPGAEEPITLAQWLEQRRPSGGRSR